MYEENKIQLLFNLANSYKEITEKTMNITYDVLHDSDITILVKKGSDKNEVQVTVKNTKYNIQTDYYVPWFELQKNTISILKDLLTDLDKKIKDSIETMARGIKTILYQKFELDPDKNPISLKGEDIYLPINNRGFSISFKIENDLCNFNIFKDDNTLTFTLGVNMLTPLIISESVIAIIDTYIETNIA